MEAWLYSLSLLLNIIISLAISQRLDSYFLAQGSTSHGFLLEKPGHDIHTYNLSLQEVEVGGFLIQDYSGIHMRFYLNTSLSSLGKKKKWKGKEDIEEYR